MILLCCEKGSACKIKGAKGSRDNFAKERGFWVIDAIDLTSKYMHDYWYMIKGFSRRNHRQVQYQVLFEVDPTRLHMISNTVVA